jgi:ribosomal protein L10
MVENLLKQGKLYELRHELRLSKLKIQKARNEIALSTTEVLDYEDLHLELHNLDKAVKDYKDAILEMNALNERIRGLEVQAFNGAA